MIDSGWIEHMHARGFNTEAIILWIAYIHRITIQQATQLYEET